VKKALLLLYILISTVTFAQQKGIENKETDEFNEDAKSSINDEILNDFKVYPNPTKNGLTVNIGKLDGGISFQINDVLGKLVYDRKIVSYDLQKDKFKLDMSSFKEGIYMFSIKTKTFSKTIKVVKL
jgi:hypothetical protein